MEMLGWKIPRSCVYACRRQLYCFIYVEFVTMWNPFPTIRQTLHAIKFYHKICNYPDPFNHLKNMYRSFERKDTRKLENIRTMTICLLPCSGFLRFSECIKLRRSDISIFSTHAKIFIEQSKTDECRQGHWLHIARLNSELCPIKALEKFVDSAKIQVDCNKFLFRGIQCTKNAEKLRSCENTYITRLFRHKKLRLAQP